MKRFGFLLIVAAILGLMFGYQYFKGCWNKNELGAALTKLLPEITKNNLSDMQCRVVEKAREFEIRLAPADVQVTYEPTDDKKFAQQFVAKIADFKNFRAQIRVNAPVQVWGYTVDNEPLVKWQITPERAVYKANAAIEKAIKEVDNVGQPSPPPSQPQPPPLSRQGIGSKIAPARPELDKELNP
jgi:hypothetical protein